MNDNIKKGTLFLFFFSLVVISCAQQESYDLSNFTAPKGWQKENAKDVVAYTKINNQKRTWCRIAIYKSTNSKGSVERDFDSEWQNVVAKPFNITAPSDTLQYQGTGEWKIKSGAGKFSFENAEAEVALITYSGYNRCVSIVVAGNGNEYDSAVRQFLNSFSLKAVEQTARPEKPVHAVAAGNPNKTSIVGIWRRGSSVSIPNGSFGYWSYTAYQYTFSENGTYSYTIKTYSEANNETLLTREAGTYTINGNNISVTPKTSVVEAWSKKNGGDNYNKLVATTKKQLEKTTYQFTIEYIEILKETGLILMADRETARDGKYSAGNDYPNGWRFSPSGPNYKPIKLPGE